MIDFCNSGAKVLIAGERYIFVSLLVTIMFENSQLGEGFSDTTDVLDMLVQKTAEDKDKTEKELSSISVQDINVSDTPEVAENPDELTEEEWEDLREQVATEAQIRGYTVE